MNVGKRNEGLDTVLKILLGIFSRNDNILQIQISLERLGHEVIPVYTDNYRQICPYYKKKLDKLGVRFFRKRYEAAWRHRLRALLDEFQPDVVLFINFVEYMLEAADLQYIQARAKTIVWFVDSVYGSWKSMARFMKDGIHGRSIGFEKNIPMFSSVCKMGR